ncbi:MFS transporter [uncultured Subdoligranulum sp.]|uniref:MFS transporter n=1 Tax=uncultured Subdoligranulum sp. TaxID=512298 RepID=UPI0025F6ED88|nr:MFS transporter [uncultured Subdoligranulum sp.]
MAKQNRGPYILAAGAGVQLLTGIPAAWGVFQKPVMQGYGLSRGQAMLGFAVLVAFYGVGCAVGGLLQDRRGPRVAGLWGTALLAGGFLAAALVPPGNAVLFLLAYSLPAGVGSAFLAPAVLACAQKWYQDKKGWATGVAGVAMGLSGAFYTLFVKGVGGRWGIRVCFAALGLLMLVVCGSGAAILQNPPQPKQAQPLQGIDHKKMIRTPQYKLCVAAVALSAPPVLLFSPEIFSIATDRGLPEAAAPFSIVLGSAASAAGRLLCPAVSDKLGRKRVLYAVYLGLAAGSAWFAFAQNAWVLAAYAMLTFFYSGGAAVQPALNTDLFGLRHAGVNYGFIALGMSAGSLLSYIGSQALPLTARHWLAGGCALAGLFCVRLVKPLQES